MYCIAIQTQYMYCTFEPEIAQMSADLGRPLSSVELDDAMAQMDEDGSGEVDFEEFCGWALLITHVQYRHTSAVYVLYICVCIISTVNCVLGGLRI